MKVTPMQINGLRLSAKIWRHSTADYEILLVSSLH